MKKSSHLVTLFMSSSYLAVGFELTMIPQHQIAYPPQTSLYQIISFCRQKTAR